MADSSQPYTLMASQTRGQGHIVHSVLKPHSERVVRTEDRCSSHGTGARYYYDGHLNSLLMEIR